MVTAKAMLNAKRLLWMGFICHLVAEKALKAVFTESTDEIPPKIHDLRTLAKRGGIIGDLSDEQLDLLEQLNPLQIEARYPEYKDKISATLTLEKCQKLYTDTEDFLCWIKQKLDKLPKDTLT
ncbi:MAG: HEPN domain-containing protein [Oscillospiraceae bacterium]|nr:HEPN domain-containing protein [Oscillospiraceae bacterium]